MPTFASRVLGRSVGRPTTRHGKAPVTRRNGRRFRSIDLRDEFALALAGRRCPKEPASRSTGSGTDGEDCSRVGDQRTPDWALMSRFGGTRSA